MNTLQLCNWQAHRIVQTTMTDVLIALRALMQGVSTVKPRLMGELFAKPLGIDKITELPTTPGMYLISIKKEKLDWVLYLSTFMEQRKRIVIEKGPPVLCHQGYSATLKRFQQEEASGQHRQSRKIKPLPVTVEKLSHLFDKTFTPDSTLTRRRSLDLSRDGRVTPRRQEYMDEPSEDQVHHSRLRAHDEHHSKAGHLHVHRSDHHELLNQHQSRSQANDQ